MRKRPTYGERLSRSVDKNGWSAWEKPVPEGYRLACCGCGLVHNVNFRVRNKQSELQFQINRRATSAMRRGKKYKAIAAIIREVVDA